MARLSVCACGFFFNGFEGALIVIHTSAWILAGGRRSGPGDASLVRERAGTFSKMRRLKHRLREQIRSYALRAEAWQPFIQGAPGLMYMMSAERRNESLCVVTWPPCPALAGG
ncbi:hypothetical protein EZZ79_09560 [Pseudomonas syringae]|nr:hypothetical protein EZZ79_09560 [Pseudomonas syringae]